MLIYNKKTHNKDLKIFSADSIVLGKTYAKP